jgi:hypothetical protein
LSFTQDNLSSTLCFVTKMETAMPTAAALPRIKWKCAAKAALIAIGFTAAAATYFAGITLIDNPILGAAWAFAPMVCSIGIGAYMHCARSAA